MNNAPDASATRRDSYELTLNNGTRINVAIHRNGDGTAIYALTAVDTEIFKKGKAEEGDIHQVCLPAPQAFIGFPAEMPHNPVAV